MLPHSPGSPGLLSPPSGADGNRIWRKVLLSELPRVSVNYFNVLSRQAFRYDYSTFRVGKIGKHRRKTPMRKPMPQAGYSARRIIAHKRKREKGTWQEIWPKRRGNEKPAKKHASQPVCGSVFKIEVDTGWKREATISFALRNFGVNFVLLWRWQHCTLIAAGVYCAESTVAG